MARQYLRLVYAVYGLGAVAIVATIYATAGKVLIDMGTGSGDFTGFLSDEISYIDSLMPILLAALVLFIAIWVIVSPAQEERTVRRRRGRR